MNDDTASAIKKVDSQLALLPAPLIVPFEQNPAAVYLATLNDESRRTMRTALNRLGELLGVGEALDVTGRDMRCLTVPWANLRYQHTTAIHTALQERYAPATANKLLAALRRVLEEARRLGQMSADDYAAAVDLKNIPSQRLPRGRLLVDTEVAALMQTCANDSTSAGARDAALLALLRGTGLRRTEVVALDLADYDLANGVLTIRDSQGQLDRQVYVPVGAKIALHEWIDTRGMAPGSLFYGLVKGGKLVPRRLAAQAVAVVCEARAHEAGVAHFTPHDMRRTFISGLLDAGASIVTVQQVAGHADPTTTSRYDAREAKAKQRISEMIHVPHYARQKPEV